MASTIAGNIKFNSKGNFIPLLALEPAHAERTFHSFSSYSGAEGRNIPHTEWLCLNEHACLVGGAVKWVRAVDGAFWPALEMHPSGVQVVASRNHSSHSSSSATSSAPGNKFYYLFAEERMVLMNSTDARLVVPYFVKSKESRMYCGKVKVNFIGKISSYFCS